MNELITVTSGDASKKILVKNGDRTCEIAIAKRGLFMGIIEKMHSNGTLEIRLVKMLQEDR
jgi:hypothetical protein